MLEKIFKGLLLDIAVDLGTANSLVYVKGKGIIINEPSVVAINKKTGQILAVGREAKEMVGRTPTHIQIAKPLHRGVVSDFEIAEQILHYFISKVSRSKFLPFSFPRVIVGIPAGVTEVERKAVFDATKNAGAKEVYLIEQAVATAVGARLPIQEAIGNFVVDIGGGTTEIAVISLGGIVSSKTLKVAGDKMNEDIIDYLSQKYRLLIGEQTAERIKIEIGKAINTKNKKECAVRGRNLVTGLPEEIIIDSEDIREAIKNSIGQIIEAIKSTIEETPPELLADVMENGIYLSGGGALLSELDVLISKETKMPVKIIEDPLTAVVRGGGIILENIDGLKDILIQEKFEEPPQ